MRDDVTRELCNAVEPVPGPLPGRCALPPHDDENHDWVPGAELLQRAQGAQQALTSASAAAINASRPEARMAAAAAGAGDRLPGRGVVRRVVARWKA